MIKFCGSFLQNSVDNPERHKVGKEIWINLESLTINDFQMEPCVARVYQSSLIHFFNRTLLFSHLALKNASCLSFLISKVCLIFIY